MPPELPMSLIITDPRIQNIPVLECGEPLVYLEHAAPAVQLDRSAANLAHLGYPPDFRLRESVAQRIAKVQLRLGGDYHLLVKECYRPLAIQAHYFQRYLARLRTAQPTLDAEALYREAAKYVAPPECATHVTGAALDLTLSNPQGVELDLGTVYDAAPGDSDNACYTDAPNISEEASFHRALLKTAMAAESFVNYPFEWWHWSCGDKYWAYGSAAEHAVYGPLDH